MHNELINIYSPSLIEVESEVLAKTKMIHKLLYNKKHSKFSIFRRTYRFHNRHLYWCNDILRLDWRTEDYLKILNNDHVLKGSDKKELFMSSLLNDVTIWFAIAFGTLKVIG